MNLDEYFDLDAVNFSTLKNLSRSPKHYRYSVDNDREDTTAFLKGRAFHTAVLEPGQFDGRYAIYTGKTRRGKEWDAFKAANEGREILKVSERSQAFAMRDAVLAHPVAGEIFKVGVAEQGFTWTDEATGILCKARLDWWNFGCVVDLKSTPDVDERRFGALAARMKYFVQLAWYSDALRATGWSGDVKIIGCEIAAPHDVAVFSLSDDDLQAGRETYQGWLAELAECRSENAWPGRYPEEQQLCLPAYVFEDADLEDDSMEIITEEEDDSALEGAL